MPIDDLFHDDDLRRSIDVIARDHLFGDVNRFFKVASVCQLPHTFQGAPFSGDITGAAFHIDRGWHPPGTASMLRACRRLSHTITSFHVSSFRFTHTDMSSWHTHVWPSTSVDKRRLLLSLWIKGAFQRSPQACIGTPCPS